MNNILPSINEKYDSVKRPVRAIQFGEGNFLRAFVDYMLDILNEKGCFNGNVTIIKPIEYGSVGQFAEQGNVYTVLLRGLVDGSEYTEQRVVSTIDSAISCYEDYDEFVRLAELDTLRFVISNTTEAGIAYDETDDINLCPPKTYPGKLTKFLYRRYLHFLGDKSRGLIILPVELIDDNGIQLKSCVMRLSTLWGLEREFSDWLETACVFTSTLVDRIVTGYPRGEDKAIFEQLGYEDKLLVTAEPFALWVIESPTDISGELPFEKCGLPVIFTDNQKPYKQRKVRILNGAHTSFVLAAYLSGLDYVGQAMDDELIRRFMTDTIYNEVIPTLSLPEDDLKSFAGAVIDRFKNPFIKHALLSIALNSVSKWKARCLPSFTGYIEKFGRLPKHLTFSLAALAAFYTGSRLENNVLIGSRNADTYEIKDEPAVLEFFRDNSDRSTDEFVTALLSNESFWGQSLAALDGVTEAVTAYLADIRKVGMKAALSKHFS